MPTLDTLKGTVDKLARWKINQLQLYIEHTYAYKGHEVVWKDCSPLTPADVVELDDYCRNRFIDLVPNQNCLAHMHRWLMVENYIKFAECPSKIDPKALRTENYQHEGNPGYSLCPIDPATLELVKGLFKQLLPNFSSRQVNVGLDEPNDLSKGEGRSQPTILRQGVSQVYLNYLVQVRDLVKSFGIERVMQFWADFVLMDNELIDQLPKDVVAMLWGYEDGFPFELGKRFTDRKIKWYACPSTCTWSSLGGRTQNAIRNLTQAAVKGKAAGAFGYLMTEWGDNGHHQPLSVSYLGIILGASLSWKVASQEQVDKMDLPSLLNLHAFGDVAGKMGVIAHQVGDLYRLAIKDQEALEGCSVLFRLLVFNDDYPDEIVTNALSKEGLLQVKERLDKAKRELKEARVMSPEGRTSLEEYHIVIELLSFSSRFGLVLLQFPDVSVISKLPKSERKELKAELSALIDLYKQVWLMRNRLGGLEDSTRRLKHLQSLLD